MMKKSLYVTGIVLFVVPVIFYLNWHRKEDLIAMINQNIRQAPSSAGGTIYFVSPSGSDSNTGTTVSTPVKTIKKAVGMAMSSGDTIYVMNGTYVESIWIGQSNITLSAYPGDKPVIDGQSTLPSKDWGSLVSVGGNYNTIDGFEIKNSNINGAYLGGYGLVLDGHHNTVKNMNVHHSWQQGVYVHGDYNIVEDSSIWQASRANFNGVQNSVGYGWGTGMSAARNKNAAALIPGITSYATFRRNKVFNNWGEGLSCFEADHCTIEDNIVYDNWTVNVYLSDSTNSLLQRNIIYVSSTPAIPTRNNSQPGLTLADEVSSVPRSANNTIINNFIYNTDIDAFSWTLVPNSGLNNVLIANNTIVDGGLVTGYGGNPAVVNTTSQISNNIILGTTSSVPNKAGITFSNNNWTHAPTNAVSQTDVNQDPLISRAGSTAAGALTPDFFKTQSDSPVISKALPLSSVSTDFFKVNRNSAPDIGAYEFEAVSTGQLTASQSTADATAPTPPSSLSATANSSTKVDLAWTASTDNVNVDGYIIYRDGAQIASSAVTNFADTAVVGGTTYNYIVKAFDAANNLSIESNTATVKTPDPVVQMNINSYSVTNVTSTSVTINWTTNLESNGLIAYGTNSSNLNLSMGVNNLATSNSAKIAALKANTQYYYKITASNGSNTAQSSVNTFITRKR